MWSGMSGVVGVGKYGWFSRGGARLYLHEVHPRSFLSSAENANRVRGCYQVCFLLSAGLTPFILDVGGGGELVFSS